jgi:two-component system, sensor histidine kinase and response regulator
MTAVLLVDDDPRMQVLGRKVLERHGYRVVLAANGTEAAEAAAAEPFDLVLMDLEMPRIDGHEALRLIKAEHPTLPVVAVTAYAMAGDSERCRAEGFDDYISKPYDIVQLRAVVARLTAGR